MSTTSLNFHHVTETSHEQRDVPGTGLSDFIRNATPERKAEVYGAVMDKATERQQAVIASAQVDAVRLDYGLSKYASLSDAMDGAIREIAALRAARDELVAALNAVIAADLEPVSYAQLIKKVRAALTKATPEQQEQWK